MDMFKSFSPALQRAIQKWAEISFAIYQKHPNIFLLTAYSVLAFPFFLIHESHLPALVALPLAFVGLLVGAVFLALSFWVFRLIQRQPYHILWELILWTIGVLAFSSSSFFENRAGWIFVFFVAILFTLFRFFQIRIYYLIAVAFVLLFSNALLSFRAIQQAEITVVYLQNRAKYPQSKDLESDDWIFDENTRLLKSPSLQVQFQLPEEMHFFQPKQLSMKEKTGTGQIVLAVSWSDVDPNRYPFLRMFWISPDLEFTEETLRSEMLDLLEFGKHQGELEDVQELEPNLHSLHKWLGRSWTFYDLVRPRYSKTGYYLIPEDGGGLLVLYYRENLEKGQTHEPMIKELLDSLKWEK